MQNSYPLPRTQRVVEHLENAWRRIQQPSSATLRQITEYSVTLPNQYNKIGLQTVAEQTINNMKLHILSLMILLQEKAEQEGISAEELVETLDYIKPKTFQLLEKLSKSVLVQSLDDLAVLVNISTRLQTLSTSYTAQEAQSWLFELPDMYYQQLAKEGLVAEIDKSESETTDTAKKQHTKLSILSSQEMDREREGA